MTVVASSPGKLILIGEYAVLSGAPALVMAVDRRAEVTAAPAPGPYWTVTAPGLTDVTGRFVVGPNDAPEWLTPELGATEYRLVDRLLAGLFSADLGWTSLAPAAALTLDTRPFFAQRDGETHKLGLGSSAALTTALVTALRQLVGEPERAADNRDWLTALVELHRRVQDGRGSGIDVAASLLGGVVRYRLANDGTVAEADACELPPDLRFRCVWTGRGAGTSGFLERLEALRAEDPRMVDRLMGDLAEIAADGVEAVASGAAAGFLAAVDRFTPALDALGKAIGMPVLSPDHRLLWQLALAHGVNYKPSGAGGGDFGLAFARAFDPLEAYGAAAQAQGFDVLDLAIDPVGTSVIA